MSPASVNRSEDDADVMVTSSVMSDGRRKAQRRNVPVDSGWAWVVLAACFMNMLLATGYLKVFGMVYVRLLDIFQLPHSVTVIVMAVHGAVFSFGGLLTQTVILGFLSIRTTVILGGVIHSLGIIATVLVRDFGLVVLMQSVVAGFACSMIMNPSVTAVCQYFRRRRALATGVTWIGANVGGMVVPPLMEHLLQKYGFQGALLLYGGLALNVVACGALLRPLPADSLEDSNGCTLAEDEDLLESAENGQTFVARMHKECHGRPGDSALEEPEVGCPLVEQENILNLNGDGETVPAWVDEGFRYSQDLPGDFLECSGIGETDAVKSEKRKYSPEGIDEDCLLQGVDFVSCLDERTNVNSKHKAQQNQTELIVTSARKKGDFGGTVGDEKAKEFVGESGDNILLTETGLEKARGPPPCIHLKESAHFEDGTCGWRTEYETLQCGGAEAQQSSNPSGTFDKSKALIHHIDGATTPSRRCDLAFKTCPRIKPELICSKPDGSDAVNSCQTCLQESACHVLEEKNPPLFAHCSSGTPSNTIIRDPATSNSSEDRYHCNCHMEANRRRIETDAGKGDDDFLCANAARQPAGRERKMTGNMERESKGGRNREGKRRMRRRLGLRLREALELTLFRDPKMSVLLAFTVFAVIPSALLNAFLPALAASKGLGSEVGALALSVASAAGLSKLAVGWLADRRPGLAVPLFCLALLATGVLANLTPLYNQIPSFLLYSALYGCAGDLYFALQPVLEVELLGRARFAAVYGYVQVTEGVGVVAAFFFTGWLRDASGNFDAVHHFLGACAFVAAAILLVARACGVAKPHGHDE